MGLLKAYIMVSENIMRINPDKYIKTLRDISPIDLTVVLAEAESLVLPVCPGPDGRLSLGAGETEDVADQVCRPEQLQGGGDEARGDDQLHEEGRGFRLEETLPFHRGGQSVAVGFKESLEDGVKCGQSEGGEDDDDEPAVPETLGEDEIVFLGETDVAVYVPHRHRDQGRQPDKHEIKESTLEY